MKRLVILSAAVCLLSQSSFLHAQLQLQSRFPITNGSVYTITGRNDTLFVGGQFQYIGPKVEALGFMDIKGDSLLKNYPQVSHSGGSAWVNVILNDEQGGWYIGGYFTHVNGIPRLNAAHILANGQVAAWNPSPEGEIKCMAVRRGRVYLGGAFENIQGHDRSKIAMVDRQYGSLQLYSLSLNQEPREMMLLGGHLYLSGWFSQAGGTSQNFLVRTDTTSGTVDAQWNPAPNAYVYALATDSLSVFAGGDFTYIGGMPRQRLARIDLTNGQAMPFNHGVDGQIQDLIYQAGQLLMAGSFGWVDNQIRRHIAGIYLASDSLTSLSPLISYHNAYSGVNRLALNNDTLYFNGIFSSVDGQSRSGVAALALQSNQLLDWNPNASGPPYHSSVKAISKWGRHIALGGDFLMLTARARYGLAALDKRTGEVLDWNPGGGYMINALEYDNHRLWVGGNFSSFAGQNRQNLALVDLTTGLLDPTQMGIDGQVVALHRDGDFMYLGGDFSQVDGLSRGRAAAYNWKTSQWLPWNPNANARVSAICSTDSMVYLGGDFGLLDGFPASYLGRVDKTFGIADAWSLALNASVYDLLLDHQRLYVAGNFSAVGSITQKGILKLNANNGQHLNWVPATSIYGYSFDAKALQWANGTLIAGGTGYLAGRWNLMAIDSLTAAGQSWSAYPSGWNNEWYEGGVNALFATDGWLVVGGSFEKISGQIRPSLALYRKVNPPATQISNAIFHLDSTATVYLELLDDGGAELLDWRLETAFDSLGLGGWNTLISQTAALPDSIILHSLIPGSLTYLRISATNVAGTATSSAYALRVPEAPVPLTSPKDGDLMGFAVEAEIGFAMASAPQQAGVYAEAFDTLSINGPFAHMGAVYVYKQWPGQWIEWQRLLAPDRDSSDQFGYALAKNGDVLAVGAPFEGAQNNGAVYLFHRNNWDQWVFTQKITSADNASDAHFGSALDWWDNTLAVGSPGNASVHIFTYSWNNLQHQQTLLDASANSGFGHALKLYRDSLIIGAPEADGGGAASLWMLNSSGIFQETASIVNLDAYGSLRFGYAVDIGRGNLFVSDPEIERVYVFRHNGSQWNRTQTLQQTPAIMGNHFGSALSWNLDQLLIGAPGADSSKGSMQPYKLMQGQWVAQHAIPAPDGQRGDLFGWSISQGAATWIGAPLRGLADHRPSATNGGGVYALNLPLNRGILAPIWNHGNNLERAFDPQWNPLLIEEDAVAHCTPYPNPTTGLLHIPLKDIHALELLDLYGRILWQSTVNGFDSEYSLDLSPWPAGIYLLRSHKTDGDWISALLFKQ